MKSLPLVKSLTVMALAAGMLALPLTLRMPNPWYSPAVNELHEASHATLFALLTWLFIVVLRRLAPHRSPLMALAVAMGVALLLGIAIEWIQPYVGRDRSWVDAERDAMGIVAAGAAYIAVISRRRVALMAGLVTLALLLWSHEAVLWVLRDEIARNQAFPVVFDANSHWSRRFAHGDKASLEFAPPAPARLTLPAGRRWPGLSIHNTVRDWHGYTHLNMSLLVLGDKAVPMGLNVYPQHTNRPLWYKPLLLAPGHHRLRLEMPPEVAASGEIRHVKLYAISPLAEGATLQVARIWLDD